MDEATAQAVFANEERRELFRIAAQRLIDSKREGRKIDPHALEWAERIVSRIKPLGRPLTPGGGLTEPAK